jgi:hypothetical protein
MKIIYCITALLVCGCAANASREEVAAAHFGSLPSNYQQIIRGCMTSRLKDPYTAVYRFGTPHHGMVQDGWAVGGRKHFGWIVPTWINAKNGFGGYAGEQAYVMFFFDDKLIDATDAFEYGLAKSLP